MEFFWSIILKCKSWKMTLSVHLPHWASYEYFFEFVDQIQCTVSSTEEINYKIQNPGPTDAGSSTDIECTAGNIFGDASSTKSFQCTNLGAWDPDLASDPCVGE